MTHGTRRRRVDYELIEDLIAPGSHVLDLGCGDGQLLEELVEKKQVARRLQGKAFFYSAMVPKGTLLQTMMQTLARVFAGCSPQELVAQLLETSDIKPADLKLLRQTAAGSLSKKTKRKSK